MKSHNFQCSLSMRTRKEATPPGGHVYQWIVIISTILEGTFAQFIIKSSLYVWTSRFVKCSLYTLRRISNWPPYNIWYYVTYLINKSKVWLFLYLHTNLSIYRKKNMYLCTKSFMRNGRCENSIYARVPRAQHGSCRIL